MESYDAYSRVPRGGDYEGKGENRPASNRGYNIPSTDLYTIRFSNCFVRQVKFCERSMREQNFITLEN